MQKPLALIGAALFIFSLFASAPAMASSATNSDVATYAHVLRKINPRLQQWQSRDLAQHVISNAARWNIDANLLIALVTVESRWRPAARSRVGALGLGQLMPGTARILGVNPHNADQNLAGCAHYLSGLISKYENKSNQYQLAFAAYNAGPMAVKRYHGIPPFSETQRYVVKVMKMWHHFTAVVHLPSVNGELAAAVKGPASDWVTQEAASAQPVVPQVPTVEIPNK
ncbi:MAG: lytic transglycosylase domain-containing protein [Candidatus Eremiobacteraeota bacterium]|nr:lytic transglycosylase domain-containing protein [Candidatus Eremiobacteraeota bacterium]